MNLVNDFSDNMTTPIKSAAENMNNSRESSFNALSVALIHQDVTRHSTRFEIDGCTLEMVRIIGKVPNPPAVQGNCTTFYLFDLNKTTKSTNPLVCSMWEVNVDNYNKCIQKLKKQKVKLVGALHYDGSQIIFNILSVELIMFEAESRYHSLDVELQSVLRKLALKQYVQKASIGMDPNVSNMAASFNNPTYFGEF
jgi:hypothetical protein